MGGEILNKIAREVIHIPVTIKNCFRDHPVFYTLITTLVIATLIGIVGAFALAGGAAGAPHFMFAINTAISGAWNGMPYMMTAVGGIGITGLLFFSVNTTIRIIRKISNFYKLNFNDENEETYWEINSPSPSSTNQ